MHILKLEASNIKRLEAITIEPNGNMVVIGGQNEQGKSSALDCIEYALGGKKRLCDVPLHRGAEKGHIILETEMYTVKRTFTEKDSYIEVKTKEGYTVNTPQDLLNALVGDLSFDPLAFTKLEGKQQAAVLMRLLNLDFSDLNAEYKRIDEERRDIGRDGKQVKALLDSIAEDADAPESEVVVSDLVQALEQGRKTNQLNAITRSSVTGTERDVANHLQLIASLEAQLKEAREELPGLEAEYKRSVREADACVDIDLEPITQQIHDAEDTNKRVRSAKQRKVYATQYDDAKTKYEAMTARLREIEEEKAKQIAEAKFPVPGVTFSDDGVMVDGIPFSQESSAKKLRIAVAMGLASNPKLKVVLVRDGSLLDENSLKAMAEIAEQYDAQVWLERVSEGKEVSVVIKDGRVDEDWMKKQQEAQDAAA